MPSRIGEFLIKIGVITEEQVDDVLRIQKGGDSRLFGEIALELGYLDDNAIKRYVDHMDRQKKEQGEESIDEP
jgi:hypothetical protein